MAKPAFYAVQVGRKPGVYSNWTDTQAQVTNFPGARHKKFPSEAEAKAFAFPPKILTSTPASAQIASTSTPRSSANGHASTPAGSNPAKRKASGHAMDSTSATPKKVRKVGGNGGAGAEKGKRVVFCDGSCLGNGQVGSKAGIGVAWENPELQHLNMAERLPGKMQTNNRAEMFALARILERDPNPELPLTICTDSQYTISVFSEWIPGWRRRNWRTSNGTPVLNKDLILYVLSLLALRPPNPSSSLANVTLLKVLAHSGIEGNELADQLAKQGAGKPEVKARDFEKEREEKERELAKEGRKGRAGEVEVAVGEFSVEEADLWTAEDMQREVDGA